MKDQQFDQQVKILKLHHRDIQNGIKKLNSFAQHAHISEAQKQAEEISTMTYQLFKYCEQLLHTSNDESKKCHNLKQRLMKELTQNKLSREQLRKYEQRLSETEKKMEIMLKQKRELEVLNAHLKSEIKLAGFITSFTFKDESLQKGKPPKLQNSEINSISESDVHETSINSLNSQEDVELYVSVLDELQTNKNTQLKSELVEVQEQFLKDVERLNKITTQDTSNKSENCNE